MIKPGTRSPAAAINLSIVVPAYNEVDNIKPVVQEILDTLRAHPWVGAAEVVLVDDGSRDGTGTAMADLARHHHEIVVVHHEVNQGFGAALATGFAATRGVAVGFVTADGEVPAVQVIDLYREFSDSDLLLSRRQRTVGVDRKVLTWGFDLTARLILGFWLEKDLGIYLVRGEIVRSMTFVSGTGLANLEVMLQVRGRGGKVTYASSLTSVRPRLSGVSKVANLRTVVRTLLEMVKLRWRLARQRSDGGR